MKEAYKRADGKKVEGKRVVVDVERGRTVPNWYVLRGINALYGHLKIPGVLIAQGPPPQQLVQAVAVLHYCWPCHFALYKVTCFIPCTCRKKSGWDL